MNRKTPDCVSLRASGLFFIAVLGVSLVWVLLAPPRASAATFTITKTADTNDGVCDSDCSLREAIAAANAAPGDDVITLPAGTYPLTHGQLNIASNLTINDALSSTTIITNTVIGNQVASIASAITVTISDVTISGGRRDY
jgi:CSLREA domain-containing protein